MGSKPGSSSRKARLGLFGLFALVWGLILYLDYKRQRLTFVTETIVVTARWEVTETVATHEHYYKVQVVRCVEHNPDDLTLTDAGKAQAAELAAVLKEKFGDEFVLIMTADDKPSRETATLIAGEMSRRDVHPIRYLGLEVEGDLIEDFDYMLARDLRGLVPEVNVVLVTHGPHTQVMFGGEELAEGQVREHNASLNV